MKLNYPHAFAFVPLAVLGLAACGTSVPAATTRIVAVNEVLLRRTPVCFAPLAPAPTLIMRAQQALAQRVCQQAALDAHVPVIPYGSGRCLVATMVWDSRTTGEEDADCARTFYGATCHGALVHLKSMRLSLAPALGAEAVVETTAAIHSHHRGFSSQSMQALCSAAFEDYPKPLANAQFDVSVDDDDD